MFKLESYITPILLSYVDKYIKNFRPQDSQVSLWGGDASFHNLDLRLEVLEQELQLPFSFISGHIHELLIHVPWTKLASEPISITINTIECVLKLRGEDPGGSDTTSQTSTGTNPTRDRRKSSRRQDVVAPPSYVQSLVNKIVSNINIFCNNLILKYVEEDIVLSVNVKTVTLQSANEAWEPAFTELSPTQIMLRKVISLADLTICLDKRNASGKIEMYQEPLLYRCSMDVHLLRSYHSVTAKRATVTRVDIHCKQMDFSLTEQQVPMLMRLAVLALALHAKELRPEPAPSSEEILDPDEELSIQVGSGDESWAGWAWSWVPSILPIYWDEDYPSDQPIAYSGHTYHTGFYVEQASVALKVTENTGERSYYGPRKVKFVPFLLANLKGCFMDLIMAGAGWLNMQMGVSYLSIKPQGECFCGIKDDYPLNSSSLETDTDREEMLYFLAGGDTKNYMAGSLFDPESVENKSQKRTYSVSWDYHVATVTETILVERSPAVALDYVYMIELPEDFNSERLSELGSDLEYSNLHEKSLCRLVVGPMVIRLCSGLFHRIQMIQHSGNTYDYSPYSTPKPELTREQLPPASAEDFDALDSNIPIQVYQVTLFNPTIYFQLAHHPSFDPASFPQSRKRRKSKPRNQHSNSQMKYLPEVMLDCKLLDASLVRPMYPRRLVTTVCQLPAPPQHMFHACHLHINVKLLDVSSHLVLNPETRTKVLMPSNISYSQEKLLLTHYWIDPDLAVTDKTLNAENLTITCTKAKLMVIFGILRSQLDCSDTLDIIQNTSLLSDAAKHVGVEYLELCVDGLSYRSVITPVTSVINIHLAAVKAFVLEFLTNELKLEPQQALVLSGPENSNEKQADTEQEPLLSLTMQRTLDPKNQVHPPLLIFRLREVRACVDPMMWRWLRYSPEQVLQQRASMEHPLVPSSGSSVNVRRLRRLSSENSGGVDLGRRAPTPQESVHSSSDQMLPPIGAGAPLSPVAHSQDTPASSSAKRASTPTETEIQGWWSRDNLLLWFAVWRGLVLSGEVAHCVVYLPSSSLSAVGAQSIEDAIAQCLNKEEDEEAPKVLVVKFPCLALRSVAQKQGLQQYTSQLPVKLPETLWCNDKMNFPWMVSLADLSCYTLQRGTRLHFLKPLSATATIGISTKYQADQTSLASLGLCVHVDTTPMSIKMSEEQMQLMASILVGLLEFVASLQMFNTAETTDVNAPNMTDLPTPSSPTLFPESSGSQESPGTPCDTNDSSDQRTTAASNSEQVKITVWMQSTLARLNIALYTVNTDADSTKNELKLTFDMEDIMTSLDLQQVYLKVKCKVAYASIQHYIRKYNEKSWRPGSYCGLVMQGHEDLSSSPHTLSRDMDEAGGFFSMTFTRARCRNVHSRWGARKQASLLANTRQCDNRSVPESLSARYISEIVVKLQAVDFIFSAATLDSFTRVISPMLALAMQSDVPGPTENKGVNWAMRINNNSLPLLYLDTRCTRFILPAKDLGIMQHDVCLLQLDSICLTPQADNPLGRIVVRHDIYHMAQQMRMLGVPGSEVEDRQYQLDITGFSVNTGTWTNLEQCLSLGRKQRTGLHTMSENPALEWNNLTRGAESITPHMALLPVIGRLNMCIVAAPAIVFRGDILVCGHSLEFNAITDIEVSVSMEQLFLASALLKEILQFLKPLIPQPTYNQQNISTKEKQHPMSYSATLVKTFPDKEAMSVDHNRFVDSGVDCADASSISLAGGGSALAEERRLARKIVPVEVLLTAGTVTFALYEQVEASKLASILREKADNDEDRGYEAGSEEGSTEDVLVSQKKIQPMVHILIAQPHAFLSRQSINRKVQLSCFDFSVRLGEPGRGIPRGIPGMQEFPQVLLETKGGDPHPDTGIPPAFITTKWSRSLGKAAKIEIELGRPTKLHFSILAWTYMQSVINKVMNCFQTDIPVGSSSGFQPYSESSWSGGLKPSDKPMKHVEKIEVENHMPPYHLHCGDLQEIPSETTEKTSSFIRNNLGAVASISASLQQLVIVGSTAKNTSQVVLSLAGLNGNISCIMRGQSDRMTAGLDITSLMITTTVACEGSPRILLNPWSCSVNVCLAWEPWQPVGSPPLIQLTADSDCIIVDLGPEHLRCLHTVFKEYSSFLNAFQSHNCKDVSCDLETQNPDQDQHYRDDLRAGAFQFVDAGTAYSSEDLPLPYQVVFWQTPPTMAWRYPQPRALTRVDIFPVPFKVATDHRFGQESKERVLCSLQYWSECRSCYQPYAQFQLSESDMCRLQLPPPPHQVVACTWRVQLSLDTEDEDIQSSGNILISPRALAACMRVDSFFAPEQVPTFQAALNISMLKVSLHNHIRDARPLPPPLDNFMMDQLMPESQSFASTTMDNTSFFLCTRNGSSQLMELSGHVRCDVVDYAFLTQQSVVESFQCRLQLTMQDKLASLGCVTRPITLKFGPSVGHTLAVSAQLWSEAISSLTSEHQILSKYQVLLSRYVICNDTTSPLRFGQVLTDENILLGSRSCHLYSWRTQKTRQVLRVGIEEGGWVWSKPFSIDFDGTQVCNLMETPNINIVVTVSSLSSTQKKVTLSGQFMVTNLLVEHLECRVMTAVDKEGASRGEGQNLIAVGKSTAPSVLLDTSKKLALRIRFQCIEGSWSGDIPLRENTKSGQPWLVKVPLPDRGQFLSIWCRVITQQLADGIKILAMLSPLYMICSHLPMPAKVLIDTPGLKVHLQTSVEGCGEQQQLYCPGTVDHSHKLTFQQEHGVPPSNPYVPLSYSMVDQRRFFQIPENNGSLDLDAVLDTLETSKSLKWPYVGEEYEGITWVSAEQPETHVQVKYEPLGPYCKTLLVELQPWALLVNTLGCAVTLIVEELVICRVAHQGVVAPPKLENNFNFGVDTDGISYSSPPLQLTRPDWSSSFYMPRISGLIPNTGNVQTVIQCGSSSSTVAILSITSNFVREMRILHVHSSYVVCNYTHEVLQVFALAIRDSVKLPWPCSLNPTCIKNVPPDPSNKTQMGVPLVHWSMQGEDSGGEMNLYVAFSIGATGWSCPLKIGDKSVRCSFTVPSTPDVKGLSTKALVLSIQERAGQFYLSVFPEIHPQITVYNMCRFAILCAQGEGEHDTTTAVPETTQFDWWCEVPAYSSVHYTLPMAAERFPDIPPALGTTWAPLVLSLVDELSWSRGFSIMETQEQFVRLPNHGDVKVRVEKLIHTTHITIDTVSHVEISARDIRSRLLLCSDEASFTESISPESYYLKDSCSRTVSLSKLPGVEGTPDSSSETNKHTVILGLPESKMESEQFDNQSHETSSTCSILTIAENTQKVSLSRWCLQVASFVQGIHLTLLDDMTGKDSVMERNEVIALSLDNICITIHPQRLSSERGIEQLMVCFSIGDLQLDNQMFYKGGFDFPVVVVGQTQGFHRKQGRPTLSIPAIKLVQKFRPSSLVTVRMLLEKHEGITAMKMLKVTLEPLRAYVEDTLITKLSENLTRLSLPALVHWIPPASPANHQYLTSGAVPVPAIVSWESRQIAFPVQIHSLIVDPISLLLSVHTSVKLYIALDHSPLHFSAFERRSIVTTPYRLGHALTMHYLSGALFGAGWVVGSLELLGSPGGFARSLGTGLRDFVSLPFHGLFEGPWGFLVGVTHGSASLMKHITAGTLSSVTKLAASVARNLDRLTLDEEHMARTEEMRRLKPQGVTQGLVRGLTGLGISLLGAVSGIAHHPLQAVINEGPSPRGFVTGVGRGLVGVITKPLSGAAELLALTGEGLLHGAGWASIPEVRQYPVTEYILSTGNSRLKYNWKIIMGDSISSHARLLHVMEATHIATSGSFEAVTLVLTTRALFLIDTEKDVTKRVLSLMELTGHPEGTTADPTLLSFLVREMDIAESGPHLSAGPSHDRVVDFVRRSSGMVGADHAKPSVEAVVSKNPLLVSEHLSSSNKPLMFCVNPQSRNYFLSLFKLAKRQSQGKGFSLL